MRPLDILGFARDAATGSPVRTLLMTLAMSIGVAAVVLLTALGDGARRYVVDQFSSIEHQHWSSCCPAARRLEVSAPPTRSAARRAT